MALLDRTARFDCRAARGSVCLSAPWLENFRIRGGDVSNVEIRRPVDSTVQFRNSLDVRTRWTTSLTAFRDTGSSDRLTEPPVGR